MLDKCSMCGKEFPKPTLKAMVQIVERKAYSQKICPSCQAIITNNPSYYYLVEAKKK